MHTLYPYKSPAEHIEQLRATIKRKDARIAELEAIVRLTHIHSRKHTPGYCIVRQSDIDAIGNIIDPPVIVKKAT